MENEAALRDEYREALNRFESSLRLIRMVLVVWAKREHGTSYRSMGPSIGVSGQMAVRLGREGEKRFPPSSG